MVILLRLTQDPLQDTHHMVDHAQTSELLENTKSLHTNGRSIYYLYIALHTLW